MSGSHYKAPSAVIWNTDWTCAAQFVLLTAYGTDYSLFWSMLVYADDVNILGGSVHTIKENAEALVVASKEIGPEVNADKTNNIVMSRDQNEGRSHNIKIENSSFERVEQFKYLGTTLRNRNSVQEEIEEQIEVGE